MLQVDDQGNLLYVFPELQRTGGAAQVGRQRNPCPPLGVVFIRVLQVSCVHISSGTAPAAASPHQGSRTRHPCVAACMTSLPPQLGSAKLVGRLL